MVRFLDTLRAARKAVWDAEPAEVRKLLDPAEGYTDTWESRFFPTLYGWLETVCSRNVLHVLRRSLLFDGLQLESARTVAARLLSMYVPFLKWANLPETTELFEGAAEAVGQAETREELAELLEELILYSGRLNYRIEPHMPWPELIETFKEATGGGAGPAGRPYGSVDRDSGRASEQGER
jgi:hypothetical protein